MKNEYLTIDEMNTAIVALRERVEKLEEFHSSVKLCTTCGGLVFATLDCPTCKTRVEMGQPKPSFARIEGKPVSYNEATARWEEVAMLPQSGQPAPEVRTGTGTGESDGACYPCFVCGKSLPNGARCSCGYKPSPQQMGTYTHAPRNTTLATSSLRHLCLGPDGPVVRECGSLVCSLCGDGFKINIDPSCGSGEARVRDEKTAWSIYHVLTQSEPAPQPGETPLRRAAIELHKRGIRVATPGCQKEIVEQAKAYHVGEDALADELAEISEPAPLSRAQVDPFWTCKKCGEVQQAPKAVFMPMLAKEQVEEVVRDYLEWESNYVPANWKKDQRFASYVDYLAARERGGK